MAVVQMPAGAVFAKRAWTPPSQNQVNRSGWTGARKVLRLPGAGIWKVTASLKPISRAIDAWPWGAFLAALEGEANTFLMPACDGPQWRAADTPTAVQTYLGVVAQGANQIGLEGFGGPGLRMRAGQKLSAVLPSGNTQMFALVQDAIADANGRCIVKVRSLVREALPLLTIFELAYPVCEMAMVGKPVLDENEGIYTLAFDAEEAF